MRSFSPSGSTAAGIGTAKWRLIYSQKTLVIHHRQVETEIVAAQVVLSCVASGASPPCAQVRRWLLEPESYSVKIIDEVNIFNNQFNEKKFLRQIAAFHDVTYYALEPLVAKFYFLQSIAATSTQS